MISCVVNRPRTSVGLLIVTGFLMACGSNESQGDMQAEPGGGTHVGGAQPGGASGANGGSGPQNETPVGPVPANPSSSNGKAQGDRGECGLEGGGLGAGEKLGDCEDRTLPGTGGKYCIKAHPSCKSPGVSCPMYVLLNLNAYFNRVDQPQHYGPLIVVRLHEMTVDAIAELPRVIAKDYPSLDGDRLYILGWSLGSARMDAALYSKADTSPYGSTSDLYAAAANLGGCMKSDGDPATPSKLPVIMVNGQNDPFGECDRREEGRKNWSKMIATKNGCSDLSQVWQNVTADDPLMAGGNGTDIAQKLTFGQCPGGDLLLYRFRDHGHDLSFGKHISPKVSASAIAWDFFQGRRRGQKGGVQGQGSACYQ